jgi:hypothetical protein
MSTPTIISPKARLHAAIFNDMEYPDVGTLWELVNQGQLDYFSKKLALVIIRGHDRQQRKQRGLARYLRHYRRIARSLQ